MWLLGSLLALSALAADPWKPPALLPGDAAPPLQVEAWLHGGPVAPGTSGRVTLVEFTATWCGPCRAFLPELVAIARDHADLDVASIYVYEQDRGQVEASLAAHDPDALPPHVGYSPDDAPYAEATWMAAAGRDGIPTVFLVEADGTIAWIGYPEEGLSRVLDQVLDGTWDPMPLRAAYVRAQRREALMEKWEPRLVDARGKPLSAEETLEVLESAAVEDPDSRYALASDLFDALSEVDPARARTLAADLTLHAEEVSGGMLGDIARSLDSERRYEDVDPGFTRILAEAANQRYHWSYAPFLALLADVLWTQGDRDGAIDLLEHAVKVADPGERRWYDRTLRRFERRARKG